MNVFAPNRRFERIVCVEMFEHMMNWCKLLTKLRCWPDTDGRFLMQIFTHRSGSYLFDNRNRGDGIVLHFFTGGVMPSHHPSGNICSRSKRNGAGAVRIISAPRATGLVNFDRNRDAIEATLRPVNRNRAVDPALALVLPFDRWPVRPRRRHRMGHQPLPDEGCGTARVLIIARSQFRRMHAPEL